MLYLANKTKIMGCVTIIVVALSITSILVMLAPTCSNCASKLCFGRCTIVYDMNNSNDTTTKGQKTNQNTTQLVQTQRADESYLENIVFIGDSRTIALQLYGISLDNIFAEDGLNHEHAMTKEVVNLSGTKLTTIKEAVLVTAPDIMIVNFGINGAAYMPVDTFIEGYEEMIDQLIEASPDSIIVVEAIMPVSKGHEQTADGCSNEKIDDLNNALYIMAKDKGIHYLATDEVLKNENNDLVESYHGGDGLHYSSKAYDVIIEYILTHAIYRE